MTARAKFTQADIRRAMKAAQQAGYDEPRVIIHPNGQIEVVAGKHTPSPNDYEEDFDL